MNVCPSCLKEGYESFCKSCLRKLFNGRNVSHVLSITQPEYNEVRLNRGEQLSISGIQIKHSMKLEGKTLVLTERGGEYILKPIPTGSFQNLEATPANEHLTMQIADQLFNIKTPPNALIKFKDNKPAYIVKRFDVLPDGTKLLQEDFAQVAGKTEENAGKNYKYDFSYEEIAELMKKYISAYPIEVERFFALIIFNYLVSNGDAHLKNFSVFRNSEFGDYTMTPAYDLLNTSIHVPTERDIALELFKGEFITESYKHGSKYGRDDFYEIGIRIGISKTRIDKIYQRFLHKEDIINSLIRRSFLSNELKGRYFESIVGRLERLG